MPESLAYVILGRGRWARKLCPIISGEGRSVVAIEETRQLPFETEPDYVDRLAVAMRASSAQIAWLCVLPGPHVSLMIQAAIDAGLHVIAEKPWYGSNEDTQKLQSLARANGRIIAVHFEYLVLEEVEFARNRGANILAEVVGYGMSGDAHHITQPAENGDGAYRVMTNTLQDAKVERDGLVALEEM